MNLLGLPRNCVGDGCNLLGTSDSELYTNWCDQSGGIGMLADVEARDEREAEEKTMVA